MSLARYLSKLAARLSSDGKVPTSALGAGAVLQIVSVTKTDTWSATTQTFVDITGLAATITPRDANSKILVIVDLALGPEASNASIPRILRDSTPVYVGDAAGVRPQGLGQAYSGNAAGTVRHGGVFVDSPASASSITYKAQLRSTGLVIQYVNRTNRDTNSADYDARGVSSITLMEIAG
jgi:hypothetical protein